jgi:hypothetical protein
LSRFWRRALLNAVLVVFAMALVGVPVLLGREPAKAGPPGGALLCRVIPLLCVTTTKTSTVTLSGTQVTTVTTVTTFSTTAPAQTVTQPAVTQTVTQPAVTQTVTQPAVTHTVLSTVTGPIQIVTQLVTTTESTTVTTIELGYT